MSSTNEVTVAVEGVSKSFGTLTAVSDLTFQLSPGVTALLGPNGAGKSTLLRLLVGLEPPSTGQVSVMGANPRTSATSRAAIGIVPQQDGIFERATAFEAVHLAAVLSRVDDPASAACAALARVELDPMMKRPAGTFSKGMRQRVKVAQALVHDPAVLMLDEPLNGLDPRQRRHMISLFAGLGADGKTVIVSSHVLDEVERFGSHVLVLAKGRMAAQGNFQAIRALMDDQPTRVSVTCSDAKKLAGQLLSDGMLVGCELKDSSTVEFQTVDIRRLRLALVTVCGDLGLDLQEVRPLDDDLESVFRYLVGSPAL